MGDTQVVEQATPVTTPATTPSPVETPSAFKGKGMGEVFKAADAEVEAEVAATATQTKKEIVDELLKGPDERQEASAEKTAEEGPEDAEQAKDKEDDPELTDKDWRVRVSKVKKALEVVSDPKLRKMLVDSFMTVEGYRKAGIRLSDIEHYKSIAPTPEVLDEIAATADEMRSLRAAIASNSEEGVHHIMRTLVQVSPQGTRNFVAALANHMEEIHPPAWRAMGMKLTRNLVATMRRAAKEGNPLLEDSARDVAIITGLEADESSENSERLELPPEIQREREELELLKRQEVERRQQEERARRDAAMGELRDFHQGVMSDAFQEGAKVVEGWIEENVGSYNNATKAKLFDSIGDALVRRIDQNPHIQDQYNKILGSSYNTPEHRERARRYLVSQAKALLPIVAAPILREFSEIADGVNSRRQEKLNTASARRDLGSSGVAPTAPRVRPLSGRGKTYDQVFAEFEAQQK